ncbi:hypothetical protein KOM00_19580 [Geomonas sp. Red69]|uniref:Uncharacterized protein n=1 Tax=Geomonas diazotrophica TaxID=2843197 RepID=A0ABX8JLT6_9BACT|nr:MULTISPECIES: hypothetical protein [Geomonas]MBU5638927.1 hypothetical protein [Geomonas diazotrophica]QWV96405.1 hypothetical protein KP005_13620 [Geomonas nitrogeniifigens]QXE85472.1 hypothetical protein KP003_13905 [Geomonas nitrogeniifigens]
MLNHEEKQMGGGEAPEEQDRGRYLNLLLLLLAAINLVVMMVMAQRPVPLHRIEHALEADTAHGVQVRLEVTDSHASYHFRSCGGGDSTTCHREGNLAFP